MLELVDINHVIATLRTLGYEVNSERGQLVGMDIADTHEYPIILDRSQGFVPLEDIVDQVRAAGVTAGNFREALDSVVANASQSAQPTNEPSQDSSPSGEDRY